MQEFRQAVQFSLCGKTLLQIVFNRLDIVVGGCLNGFDTLCRLKPKIVYEFIEKCICLVAKIRNLWDIGAGCERLEPANLDDYPVTDQTVFTENSAQAGGASLPQPCDL